MQVGATEARGISRAQIHELFVKHGEPEDGNYTFPSMRKLREALEAAHLSSGNRTGDALIAAIQRDYCTHTPPEHGDANRPIRLQGENPKTYTWRGHGLYATGDEG